MIDIWAKLFSDQLELALNLSRAVFGLGPVEKSFSQPTESPSQAAAPDTAEVPASTSVAEPDRDVAKEDKELPAAAHELEASVLENTAKTPRTAPAAPRKTATRRAGSRTDAAVISRVTAFIESADSGATVREIAQHLKMDTKSILPLLKTMVKEKRIDELLGRYCVVKS
jgi:hypothetical protein